MNDSVVVNYFDMGLCEGEELDQMVSEILPALGIRQWKAWGFEPCRAFYEPLARKYAGHPDIGIFPLAISDRNGPARLYHSWQSKEGHSLFDSKHNVSKDDFEDVECVLFSDWLVKHVPHFRNAFNIIRFNIEGAEWHLLNDLAARGWIPHVAVFCGHGNDVPKIGELRPKLREYYRLLRRHRIRIHLYCSIYPETGANLREVIRITMNPTLMQRAWRWCFGRRIRLPSDKGAGVKEI